MKHTNKVKVIVITNGKITKRSVDLHKLELNCIANGWISFAEYWLTFACYRCNLELCGTECFIRYSIAHQSNGIETIFLFPEALLHHLLCQRASSCLHVEMMLVFQLLLTFQLVNHLALYQKQFRFNEMDSLQTIIVFIFSFHSV